MQAKQKYGINCLNAIHILHYRKKAKTKKFGVQYDMNGVAKFFKFIPPFNKILTNFR